MNRKNRRTLLRVLFITLATMSFLVWSFSGFARYSSSGAKTIKVNKTDSARAVNKSSSELLSLFPMLAGGTKPAGNLDQVRNGSAASPLNPVDWVNGNAGASNAHYKEGQSIPYRLVLTNLPLGPNSVKIEWDIRHSSKNAIDYITSVVRQPPGGIAEAIHVCGDGIYNTVIAGCNEAAAGYTIFTIPAPPVSKLVGAVQQPATSFANLPANDKLFRIYNGTDGVLTYINNADGDLGDLNVAQSSTRASISFNATSPTVVLAWSGHIASRVDWLSTNGVPNSAGGISGSPYHTRLIELCPDSLACGGGNQDRSLSAAAVTPPAECNLSGPDTVCEGGTPQTYTVDPATLDTSATYTFALSNNTAGATIGNTNGNPLTPPVYAEVTTTGPGSFTITATATNGGGSSPGCPVIVTVTASTSATDPTALTRCEGGSATFSTTASGTGSFTYQWQKDGVNIPDETSSSYTINPVATSDAGTYRVVVSGTCGSDTTEGALLTVNTTTTTSDPADATKCEGDSVTFSTTAAGTPPLGGFTYQWKKDGVTIPGATGSSYTINSVATGDAGTYTVYTTGACNTANQSATLAVNETVGATDPAAVTSCIGSVANFSTTASGTGSFTYQWQKDGVNIPSATSSSYTINPVATSDAGTYRVIVTGACGETTTAGAILTVNNPSVSISLHSGCDSGVYLQADPTGSGTFTYQWALNDIDIVNATNSTLVPTVPGKYSVTVHDGNSCPASASRNLCFAFQGETAMADSTSGSTLTAKAKPEAAWDSFGLVRLLLAV